MAAGHNIVFVQCDSMDGRVMGCMGHPAMANGTPNLDALARAGVLFRNAYCNNPISCPSRASMWSGLYTHHCEGWNNHKGLEKGAPTFMTRLDEAGYRTQICGKTDYLSGAHSIRARVTPWTRSLRIMRPSYRMGPPRVLDEDKPRLRESDWDDVDRSVEWLRERKARDEMPFVLYLGIRAPHPGFSTSRTYLDMIDESAVTIPPPDESDHPVLEYQRRQKNWMHGFSDEVVKTVRRVYFAMIAEVDAMVGQLLAAMDDLGLAESTYFIFTSDHGELAMEHGQFYKMSPYEASARVPLIVRGPGVRQGSVLDELVSLVDIYPTLMDMTGTERPQVAHSNGVYRRPSGLDGYSLMPELVGGATEHPGWVLVESHGTTLSTGCFMLRRGDWKYVVYVGCEPQLFNLAEDPDEVVNRAGTDPDVVGEMDALLRRIVDYEAVDAKVKEYDRRSFRAWREDQKRAGTYEDTMARVHSGWDRVPDEEVQPWTEEEERQVLEWLGE